MGNLELEEFGVYLGVDVAEEVLGAAVDDDVLTFVLEHLQIVDDGVLLPALIVVLLRAEPSGHLPFFGEGHDVYAAAVGAHVAPDVGMAHGQPQGAVAAHRQAGDGVVGRVGAHGLVAGAQFGDELAGDERLHLHRLVDGAVPVPRVHAGGQNHEETVVIGQFGQIGAHLQPLPVVAAVAVEQIDDGEAAVVADDIGGYHHHLHGLGDEVLLRGYGECVDSEGVAAEGDGGKD